MDYELGGKHRMSNNGTESNSLKKHASSAKNGKRNSSRSNIKKREKKLAETSSIVQKKADPILIVNKDVIRETRKMEEELKKENTDTVTKLENEKNFEEKTTVDHKDENPEISEKRTVEIKNDLGAASELLKDEDKKADKIPLSESEEKKDRRPVSIELKGRSDAFKKIIDIALAYEKLENDQKKLKEIIRLQNGENSELKEEIDNLKRNLEETEVICQQRQNAIEKLQADIKHRNEVIDIVKADKDESSQEFKNALAASLRIYRQDFTELKELDMSNDVGFAVIDILESVFKTLGKNGIGI